MKFIIMSLEFGTYKIIDQGKMIKDSKRSHVWIIYFNGEDMKSWLKKVLSLKNFGFTFNEN